MLVHEWALAQAVVREIVSLVSGEKKGVVVEVVLGELQSVDEEAFSFALNTLLVEEGIKGVEVKLVREDAAFRCRRCGFEWSLESASLSDEEREAIHFVPEAVHSIVRCPKCGSRDYDVVRGRGVKVRIRE